jgi:hypothetical protein
VAMPGLELRSRKHQPVNSMLGVEFRAFITRLRDPLVEFVGNPTNPICVAARGAMD